ncbi:MAG: SMC-Scp complex subunit ScpB [Parcubacteria group bacterium]|nr:SMC-Scp complex subunit ScpB [Parcubacteria group bacterium]
MDLANKIEAVLFFKGEPIKATELAKLFKVDISDVESAIKTLHDSLTGRGVTLLQKDGSYALRTSADASDVVEKLRKDEFSRDIGKAGLEIISILLYKGPTPRSEIDYIRGVNSTFTLRTLLIRGLVERVVNPSDARSFLYKPSFELLAFLGISRVEDLPDYTQMKGEIAKLEDRLNDEIEDGNETTTT